MGTIYQVTKNDGRRIYMTLRSAGRLGGLFASKADMDKSSYESQVKVKLIKSVLTEEKLTEVSSEISISLDDFDKVRKLLKPKTNQIVKHPFSKKTFGLKVDKKKYDKTLEILMKKRIDVRG